MIVKIYTNNNAKMDRSIKASKQEAVYKEFNILFSERTKEWKEYFTWPSGAKRNKMVQYIKFYRKNRLLGLRQVYYSPIDFSECWEIREKDFTFTHTIGRECGIKGIEIIYTNYLAIRYKDIQVSIGNRMFEVYNLGNVYNEIFRFFKLLTDYSKEFPIKEVVVKEEKKKKEKKKKE